MTYVDIGKIRDNFFLNRTAPLWNDLPVKVKEEKSLNGFKAGAVLHWCLRVVNGFLLDWHATEEIVYIFLSTNVHSKAAIALYLQMQGFVMRHLICSTLLLLLLIYLK